MRMFRMAHTDEVFTKATMLTSHYGALPAVAQYVFCPLGPNPAVEAAQRNIAGLWFLSSKSADFAQNGNLVQVWFLQIYLKRDEMCWMI